MSEIKRKPKMNTRQQVINRLIDEARQEVIYAEIQRDFYKSTEGQLSQDVIEVMFPEGNITIQLLTKQFDANYKYSLMRLNYLKDLRKQERDKNAVKAAQRIRPTLPNIKVDLVEEK